jgi:restriction system protein
MRTKRLLKNVTVSVVGTKMVKENTESFMGFRGTPEQVEKWRDIYSGIITGFSDRSPQDFERFVEKLFKSMGYSTIVTPLSRDFGADVIARGAEEAISIQAKRFGPKQLVGVQDVNQVLGSMHRYSTNKAILITTSGFTAAAEKAASTAPIELWDNKKLQEMIKSYLFPTPKESRLFSAILEVERERAKSIGRVMGQIRKKIVEIQTQPPPVEEHEPIEEIEENPKLLVAKESIGKEIHLKTLVPRWYLHGFSDSSSDDRKRLLFEYEVQLLGYSFLGKRLQCDTWRYKGAHQTDGEILEIELSLVNLAKHRIKGVRLAETLVLTDEETTIYRPAEDLQERTCRSYRFGGWSDAKPFPPKVPVKCSVFFEVPGPQRSYFLTATPKEAS